MFLLQALTLALACSGSSSVSLPSGSLQVYCPGVRQLLCQPSPLSFVLQLFLEVWEVKAKLLTVVSS